MISLERLDVVENYDNGMAPGVPTKYDIIRPPFSHLAKHYRYRHTPLHSDSLSPPTTCLFT